MPDTLPTCAFCCRPAPLGADACKDCAIEHGVCMICAEAVPPGMIACVDCNPLTKPLPPLYATRMIDFLADSHTHTRRPTMPDDSHLDSIISLQQSVISLQQQLQRHLSQHLLGSPLTRQFPEFGRFPDHPLRMHGFYEGPLAEAMAGDHIPGEPYRGGCMPTSSETPDAERREPTCVGCNEPVKLNQVLCRRCHPVRPTGPPASPPEDS